MYKYALERKCLTWPHQQRRGGSIRNNCFFIHVPIGLTDATSICHPASVAPIYDLCVCVTSIYDTVCVCVCVCVWERELRPLNSLYILFLSLCILAENNKSVATAHLIKRTEEQKHSRRATHNNDSSLNLSAG